MESMAVPIPIQVPKNVQIPPAVPPFVSNKLAVLSRALVSKISPATGTNDVHQCVRPGGPQDYSIADHGGIAEVALSMM